MGPLGRGRVNRPASGPELGHVAGRDVAGRCVAGRCVAGVALGAGTGTGEGSSDALRRGKYGRGLEDLTLTLRASPPTPSSYWGDRSHTQPLTGIFPSSSPPPHSLESLESSPRRMGVGSPQPFFFPPFLPNIVDKVPQESQGLWWPELRCWFWLRLLGTLPSLPALVLPSLPSTCTCHQARGSTRPQCTLRWTKRCWGIGKGVWGCVFKGWIAEQSGPPPPLTIQELGS